MLNTRRNHHSVPQKHSERFNCVLNSIFFIMWIFKVLCDKGLSGIVAGLLIYCWIARKEQGGGIHDFVPVRVKYRDVITVFNKIK